MTWPQITTGFLSVYIMLCTMYSEGDTCSVMEISEPTIINITARHRGRGHRLTCLVNPGGLKDETQVYWLADGNFIEEKYKKADVKNTERMLTDKTVLLHSRVLLKDFSSKDLNTNFTCVALSPAGFAKLDIKFKKARR